VDAATELARETSPWCIITGPNFSYEGQVPPHVRLEKFRPDFPLLLAGADVSVSQAGYNTVCDILRANCRSILVPFAMGGETEQSLRAERLETLKLAVVVPEHSIDSRSLIAAIGRANSLDRNAAHGLDLDGAHRTAVILRDLLAAKLGRSP
jgi:predicted glycosyltransferase